MNDFEGFPEEAKNDPFRPPAEALTCVCTHCGVAYSSNEIIWREDDAGGFWCCPQPGCNGAGYGFDIWPEDPKDREAFENQQWEEDDDMD